MACPLPEPIRMTSIDLESLEDVDDIPEAIAFRVNLSCQPREIWRQEFDAAYHRMRNPIKPMIVVEEQTLWVAFLPRYVDVLQDYFNFLGRVVATANAEEARTLEIHYREGRHEPRDRFREDLKRVRMPD